MNDDTLKTTILNEIGSGVRDEEDLILCFSNYGKEQVLNALHELDSEGELNSQTTAGHTAYAKPGNEPWKDEVKGNESAEGENQ